MYDMLSPFLSNFIICFFSELNGKIYTACNFSKMNKERLPSICPPSTIHLKVFSILLYHLDKL